MNNYIMLPSSMRNREEVVEMRMYEHAAGYGVYIMILEQMREAPGYRISSNPARIAFAINEPDADLVDRVVRKYNLFVQNDDGTITSPWLVDTMEAYDEKKTRLTNAARKAAAARWGTTNNYDANAFRKTSERNATAQKTDANIPINEPINKPIHTGVSQWRYHGGGSIEIDTIRKVCMEIGPAVSEDTYIHPAIPTEEERNTGLCLTIAKELKLTKNQCYLLELVTGCGVIGSPYTVSLIKAYKAIKSGEIKPKFVMNYILSKMPEPPVLRSSSAAV